MATTPPKVTLVTAYAFGKRVGERPQTIYQLTKRKWKHGTPFPSRILPNGKLAIPLEEALEWWNKRHPTSTSPVQVDTPYLAFRAFTLTDGKLHSHVHLTNSWEEGRPTVAVCKSGKAHVAPAEKCGCGLYALISPDEVEDQRYYGVYAAVALWGHVFAGESSGFEKGFRAQYGQVIALLCNDWKLAEPIHDIASRHKCPVTHSKEVFAKTNWVEQWNNTIDLAAILQEGEPDGHWGEGEEDDGTSLERAFATTRAACREAAAGASTLRDLRNLAREGIISISNIEELMLHVDD